MADIVFMAVALAFFGLAYLYVLGCDRIVGRDPRGSVPTDGPSGGDGDDTARRTDRPRTVTR